ncbi:hypothetical protein N7457_005802, partial [Penicillium paradoxum]|uniref:uncharacterized protein n=1 Tax=Penicillium paradoxum TaxID=176176 RepID=UPI0025494D6E
SFRASGEILLTIMTFSTDVLLPPLLPVTDDDHGAWVITVSTILLIITTLATTVTLISRFRNLRKLSWSDSTVFFSCILFIPQTTCINIASSHGIGKHRFALNDASYEIYCKALYASHLLAVLVVGSSKAAVVLLVLSLKPFKKTTLACKLILGLIGTWMLATLFALGFQCDLPRPWYSQPERCLNQEALYITFWGLHMLLDVIIIGLPVTLLHQVQIMKWKRHQISALFGMRVLVLALSIVGLQSLQPFHRSETQDQTWDVLMPVIWLQLTLSASIICTCIPTLKRVLADLQTGMMAGIVTDCFEQSISSRSNEGDRTASRINDSMEQKLESGPGSALHNSFRTDLECRDSQKILRENAYVQSVDFEAYYENVGSTRASSSSHYEMDVLSTRLLHSGGNRA